MKYLIFLVFIMPMYAFAGYEYDCNMYPGEQGGNNLLVSIEGDKAKVYSISYSEQEQLPSFVTTLHKISRRFSKTKVFVETESKSGLKFYARKGVGQIGRVDHRTNRFRLYSCEYREIPEYREDEPEQEIEN